MVICEYLSQMIAMLEMFENLSLEIHDNNYYSYILSG